MRVVRFAWRAWLRVRALPLAPLAGIVAIGACQSTSTTPERAPSVPARTCGVTVWHRPANDAAVVEVLGDWDGWQRHLLPPERADGWRVAAFDPPPGEHLYAIVEDGAWIADPYVGTSGFHDGKEVAWVDVADCTMPALRVDEVRATAPGDATIHATFLTARDGSDVDLATVEVTPRDPVNPTDALANPTVIAADVTAAPDRAIEIAIHGLSPGKNRLTVRARDHAGRATEGVYAAAWVEADARDPRDLAIYQVIVDRFRDAHGRALVPPVSLAGRAGGHLAGVRAAIESGAIRALGLNAIWLSPLYPNPDGEFAGEGGHTYSSYHGYWPIAARAIDSHLGSEADVDALVAAAHARNIRVLFDVVPNHVHEQHPYVAQHANDGWFHLLTPRGDGCVCGTMSCDWATHIESCWFTTYLPDLDWRLPAVADQMTSDVTWWLDRFDGDGLRIDAVPMMPRAATRRIADAVRRRFDGGARTFLLGENYTGAYGYSLLKYELGPFGLDSEFHFPLMWSLRAAVAEETAPLADIDAAVHAGEDAWAGAGAVMATMIGNHDVPRFASLSAGEGDADPWTPAVQPSGTDALSTDVYAKQAMALGVVFALPGAPVVYSGDEVALVGHADPDSRRVLPEETALVPPQRVVRQTLKRFAAARACSPALRRGTYRTLFSDAEHLVFAREIEGGDPVIAVVTRRGGVDVTVPLPDFPPSFTGKTFIDLVSGASASLRPALTNLPTLPLSVRLFFPEGSPCLDAAGDGGGDPTL